MAIFNRVADLASKRMPKVLSPRGHAIADYLTVATFLVVGSVFWSRHKRAALASFICGGAELATNLLTNYPGGAAKLIPFHTHRTIDLGLAAMTATMPEFLNFEDDREKKFFLAQASVITVATNLTEFEPLRPVLASSRSIRRSA